MKHIINKIFVVVLVLISIITFTAINKNSNENKLNKLKTFHKVIRLIDEQYVEDVDFDFLMEGAISGMLNKLDPHSAFINKQDFQKTTEEFDGEFEGIGIEFSIIDDYITVITPIIDGPSDKAGLQSGDKIIKINGESAYQISTADVLKKLKGPKDTSVEVTIQRKDQTPFSRTLIRDKIPLKSIVSYFIMNKNVGYIKLSRFSKKTFLEFVDAYNSLEKKGMENLLLDLRDNPGGLLDQAINLLDMFISTNDTLLYTKGRIWGANESYKATFNYSDKKIPIICLINRGSASASEIISGTLQDLDRGLVVGETSFGKGSVQRQYELDDSTATRITVAKYYTPSGRSIQRPYEDGIDEYYYYNLNDNRELTDSIKNTLPIFKTKKGRKVYGGGGITPDIYYRDTTKLAQPTLELVFNSNRPLFNYSESIKANHSQYKDFDLFYENRSLNYNDFYIWLKNNEYEISSEVLIKDWEYIENRLTAELANKIFDRNLYYKTIILNDAVVKESLKYFEQARLLLLN
ncbi:MAG: peptidase [Candidatus Marinimicrobia bacterium]|nr:peptidase [Candidatus Neomarinimicrobiota bacterium]|tara:strand:+ start:11501 stop:13060 length:1560 start_codon:yes stop_codon:yes gene_type:complete